MPKTLLLEIGTEEMPARFMLPALEQLRALTAALLADLRLPYGQIQTWGTPRRLAVCVTHVAEQQTPVVREIRGPAKQVAFDATGNPTRAAEGFARAQGVAVSELVVKATDKGEFVFAVKREEGRPAKEVLADALPQVIRQLTFPKTMRWEDSGLRFGRPIRWLVALLGEEVIPFEVAGVRSDRITYGRRFTDGHSRGKPIPLSHADLYETALELAHVIVDHTRRRQMVADQVRAAAQSVGGVALLPDDLLDEVTFLVEEPVALVGHFDAQYLALPPEILVTVMQHHQRYFPVTRADAPHQLLPSFVFVTNGMPQRPDAVQKGNEKVVTARFEDARFYFAEDRKRRLEEFVPMLRSIVFIEGLGTLADKTERLKRLAAAVYDGLSPTLLRAAELCKADLATRLVSEFTELQGVIGRVYALLDGEPPEVAEAIEDHYKPLPPDFALPRGEIGWVLAVADRLDTLCACFSHQLIPTGSHDPFGLRRAATTLLMLLRSAWRPLSLDTMLAQALRVLAETGMAPNDAETVQEQLKVFLQERLDALLEAEGIDFDLRRAVLAAGFDDVPATFARARALQRLRQERPEWFRTTVTTFTRVTNILAQARQRNECVDGAVQSSLFATEAEATLHRTVEQVTPIVAERIAAGDFVDAVSALAELAPPINRFFDEVLVMHDDPQIRRNRLALLHRIERLLRQFADFRLVQQ